VCSAQLKGGLAGVSHADMERIVIAYEPIWAIGTGLTATPAIAQNVHFAIRAALADMYGEDVAQKVRLPYCYVCSTLQFTSG
jgi:triosephosphate isomerase